MARAQRSDHENFPCILIILLVLTSVGTISFIFFGRRTALYPVAPPEKRSQNAIRNSGKSYEIETALRSSFAKSVLDADIVYILPGGGSGNDFETLDYPEWSRQRVVAAHKHYLEKKAENKQAIFLALSAGSLNAPNLLLPDLRIIFECQFMIAHLTELGVPQDMIFGDTMSWDTVTNAHVSRLFLEGLLSVKYKSRVKNGSMRTREKRYSNLREEGNNPKDLVISSSPLQVEVFTSDFHAERVKAAFDWVLNLEPSLLEGRGITVGVHSVSTEDLVWDDRDSYEERVKHEERGVALIRQNSRTFTTLAAFQAFLLMGPHKGLDSYLKSSYVTSVGAGWAG